MNPKIVCSIIAVIFGLVVVVALGCDSDNRTWQQREDANKHERALRYIPREAHNIKPLGNGWMTFQLLIDEKSHKFLYHYVPNDQECITELHSDR